MLDTENVPENNCSDLVGDVASLREEECVEQAIPNVVDQVMEDTG